LKSGSLNLLETSGPVQACNGIAVALQAHYLFCMHKILKHITLFGISLLPEIILIDFYWTLNYILKCGNKMSVSASVWMTPVDASVEWPKTKIWGWA
jgi:hypothetical protein